MLKDYQPRFLWCQNCENPSETPQNDFNPFHIAVCELNHQPNMLELETFDKVSHGFANSYCVVLLAILAISLHTTACQLWIENGKSHVPAANNSSKSWSDWHVLEANQVTPSLAFRRFRCVCASATILHHGVSVPNIIRYFGQAGCFACHLYIIRIITVNRTSSSSDLLE